MAKCQDDGVAVAPEGRGEASPQKGNVATQRLKNRYGDRVFLRQEGRNVPRERGRNGGNRQRGKTSFEGTDAEARWRKGEVESGNSGRR